MRRTTLATSLATLAVLALTSAGCGDAIDTSDPDAPVTSSPGDDGDHATDDDGDNATDDDFGDDLDVETAIEDARALLGMPEEDLPEDVRIARRGDETFALTEDYVLGRRTVELDDDGDGYRVTSVVVELPDGPRTFEVE